MLRIEPQQTMQKTNTLSTLLPLYTNTLKDFYLFSSRFKNELTFSNFIISIQYRFLKVAAKCMAFIFSYGCIVYLCIYTIVYLSIQIFLSIWAVSRFLIIVYNSAVRNIGVQIYFIHFVLRSSRYISKCRVVESNGRSIPSF